MSSGNTSSRLLGKVKNRLLAELTYKIEGLENDIKALASSQQELLALSYKLESKIQNSGYIRISDREILSKIFTGAKMYLDPKDIALVPHLILDGEWEHDITQCWLSLVKPGNVVFDIGANFGYFGLLAAQQTNRDASITLFEANPELMPYINKTLQVNSFDSCATAENLAVADKSGELKINILRDYIASSSILDEKQMKKMNKMEIEIASSMKVKASTIDEYCEQKGIKTIDLIKMDIEGYEEKAYQGMRKTVAKSPKLILFIEFTKSAYQNPTSFYTTMLKDFGNLYLIDSGGKINKPASNKYEDIIGNSEGWTMLVFSKKTIS